MISGVGLYPDEKSTGAKRLQAVSVNTEGESEDGLLQTNCRHYK